MSEVDILTAALKAMTHAAEAQANSSLAIIDELTQSRIVACEAAATLVAIHEGQKQLVDQMRQIVERTDENSRRIGRTDGRVAALESKLDDHAEKTDQRLKHLEAARKGPQSAA